MLATPIILISKRVGKNYYKIPIPLKPYNSYIKALTWFLLSVQERKEPKIRSRLLLEIITLITNRAQSGAIKKRKTFYEEVYYNRVYAHYR